MENIKDELIKVQDKIIKTLLTDKHSMGKVILSIDKTHDNVNNRLGKLFKKQAKLEKQLSDMKSLTWKNLVEIATEKYDLSQLDTAEKEQFILVISNKDNFIEFFENGDILVNNITEFENRSPYQMLKIIESLFNKGNKNE